uniref:FXYD domain-containing ion transport regulator n=1 Tax=Acanthochromis polyacanthus TaxID=80966 RepID=A0A3Q1EIV8_9TELE
MGNLTLVALIADYERLRIGGLICAFLLVAGGVSVILCKAEDDNSEI